MRKASIAIAACLILGLAITVAAEIQERGHPEIMRDIGMTRNTLRQSAEGGNAMAAAEAAAKLEGLFKEPIPIYERMNLSGAVDMANDAAMAAGEAAKAAKASNMEGVNAALGKIGQGCQGCHSQYREKAPDGSYRIKTP